MEKITYGIKNLHYAEKTNALDGTPIFGALKPWVGASEISLPPVGEDVDIYADDVRYFKIPVNQGYEGDLSIYQIPEDFRVNHLGESKDANGVFTEKANVVPKDFALVGEFTTADEDGIDPKRFALYDCSASRIDLASATKEDTISPTPFSLPITVIPTLKDEVVKASILKSANQSIFESWFDSVYYNPAGIANYSVTIKVENAAAEAQAGVLVVVGDKIAITNASGIAIVFVANGAYNITANGTAGTGVGSVTVAGAAGSETITLS